MKIWLDDIRPPPEGFIHVKTARQAMELLKTGKVEFISLDHDLGESTGYEVAKWIEEEAFRKRIPLLFWQIHSQNVVGSANMYRALQNADRFWGE